MSTDKHSVLLDLEEKSDIQDRGLLASVNQPALLLIKSDDFDLCSSYNIIAASPRGDFVAPRARSLTDVVAKPIAVPISSNVIPIRRRSAMREAQVVMQRIVRNTVPFGKRHSVSEFRNNEGMEKPPKLETFAARVAYWRKTRQMNQGTLGKKAGLAKSTISTIERGDQQGTTKMRQLAEALKINQRYLETGEGDPEDLLPPPEIDSAGPLPAELVARLQGLGKYERHYFYTKLTEVLDEIESDRRKERPA